MPLTYPTYDITPFQVVEVFAASGRDVDFGRAIIIADRLKAGGPKPEDYIIAAGDADSQFCAEVLRSNIAAVESVVAQAANHYAERMSDELAKLKARMERLDARAAQGKFTGPGTTAAIRAGKAG